jgi:MFS transporter, DHA1 family, tetracycline resistance protein
MLSDSLPEEKKKVEFARQNAIRVIFFIILLDVIGLTLLYPVTVFIVQRYSSDALMVSMMTVIYAAAQFFAAPALGKISDRYGRRPVLLVSVFGSAIGYVIFGIGGSLVVLFLSRLIDGISAGNMSTASAYIADVSPPEDRAKNFGLIGIAWGIGLITGPAIGSAASQIALEAPAFVAAGLSLLALILAYFFLPESLPAEKRDTSSLKAADFNPFISIMEMVRIPQLNWILVALCLFNFAFQGINSIQTLFLIQKFNIEAWQNGLLLVIIGIIIAVMQVTFIRIFVRRYGDRTVAITSLAAQAGLSVLVFLIPSMWLVFLMVILSAAGSAFTFPTLTTLATNRVAPALIGRLMGVTTALTSLMNIAGPFFAGVIYDSLFRGAPYWTGAAAFALAAFLLAQLLTRKVQQEDELKTDT